ncbi:GGDEF domain-containing protein [Enterovibrio sp. ZSDZ35]|uniref:GGDEF domain-containing protein n=1 Tax=Enterovibrio qingdaonensis TaxID=2899818 RepID=A0ABT5QS12_9GAMM|nr:GGDEF domain-containing protein [Enterovibrio sp. ZSDZ35]MDD1783777.1 GGDEF domain-containing protein [Enterovibrio sp. ZSDZ35]
MIFILTGTMRLLPAAICLISLLLTSQASAKIYSTPILSDAETMISTTPEKSIEIAERFLVQRRLADTTNRIHTNSEADRSIRSPMNTVHAYIVLAKANSVIGNHDAAWNALYSAREMVQENDLSHMSLELAFVEASLFYHLDKNAAAAEQKLNILFSELPPKGETRSKSLDYLAFEAALLKAIIVSKSSSEKATLDQFDLAYRELGDKPDVQQKVRYQIALGNYFLQKQSYERALAELLSAYWLASENDLTPEIASSNVSLTKLYRQQGVLDKALQHANQAAEFYEHFDLSRGLSQTQTLLADIYSKQSRYNFALVHYFNALDIESTLARAPKIANIKIAIADTYLKLLRFNQAEQYVDNAISISKNAELIEPLTRALILKGELALRTDNNEVALQSLKAALQGAETLKNRALMLECLPRLSKAYEQQGLFQEALQVQRRFDLLNQRNESRRQIQEAESFKHRQRVIERQLQIEDMQKKQVLDTQDIVEQKKINLFLLGSLCIILLILVLRHRTANARQSQLEDLREELYTHPRSGLRNLRMLNDRLSNSLAKSSAQLEQWYLGEMIHEPLSDKLSFAMFEVPFLKVAYLQHGYLKGLELERDLGNYLKVHTQEPARLYHFSDAMFIYIEHHASSPDTPDAMATKIQAMVDGFINEYNLSDVDDRLRIGMADYPFLPRAFTSINDKELIDILLMATSAARQACKAEETSQWVYLTAIESTPAACFANTNVRQACLDGINSGLIKVKTSATGGINWQTVHDSDKN